MSENIEIAAVRVGHGFDVHRWSDDPTRQMILGGVALSGPGLDGHSDADAVTHACIDALLSAAGMGDIGSWFPDTDEKYSGANSIELLSQVSAALTEAGWAVGNVDITVICDEPKIGPHKGEMQSNLSAAAGASVTVKGKTTEGLAGLQGGVQCQAVALITQQQRK